MHGREKQPVEAYEFDTFVLRQDSHNKYIVVCLSDVQGDLKKVLNNHEKIEECLSTHRADAEEWKRFGTQLKGLTSIVLLIAIANFPGLIRLLAELRHLIP